jgi:hypothetical protein
MGCDARSNRFRRSEQLSLLSKSDSALARAEFALGFSARSACLGVHSSRVLKKDSAAPDFLVR